MKRQSRRGVTLVELLIAMLVAIILGGALVSLMMSMSRFQEREAGLRSARSAGRSAVNTLVTELRMVDPEWGVESASATSVTVRVPYAMGLICASTLVLHTILLFPVDSVAVAQPGLSGFASRGAGGAMSPFTAGLTLAFQGSVPGACSSAGIQAIPTPANAPNAGSRPVTVAGVGLPILPVGTPVMLYRRVRYYFGASGQPGLTGRTALWRDFLDDAVGATELAGPFDASAAFRFYNLAATAAQTGVPPLGDIRGFEFFLPGESDRTARTRSAPEQADMTTSVFFVNRRI